MEKNVRHKILREDVITQTCGVNSKPAADQKKETSVTNYRGNKSWYKSAAVLSQHVHRRFFLLRFDSKQTGGRGGACVRRY